MKIIKKIVGFISLILVAGGALVLFWQYFRNKQMFAILAANSVVKGSLPVIQRMLLAVVAIVAGLLMFVVYMRLVSAVWSFAKRLRRPKRKRKNRRKKTNS